MSTRIRLVAILAALAGIVGFVAPTATVAAQNAAPNPFTSARLGTPAPPRPAPAAPAPTARGGAAQTAPNPFSPARLGTPAPLRPVQPATPAAPAPAPSLLDRNRPATPVTQGTARPRPVPRDSQRTPSQMAACRAAFGDNVEDVGCTLALLRKDCKGAAACLREVNTAWRAKTPAATTSHGPGTGASPDATPGTTPGTTPGAAPGAAPGAVPAVTPSPADAAAQKACADKPQKDQAACLAEIKDLQARATRQAAGGNQSTMDTTTRLGARSNCGPLRGQALANCKATGAAANAYPIDNYGYDIRIDGGLDNLVGNVFIGLQTAVAFLWMLMLYALKLVLLLLEWSFSLNLLGDLAQSLGPAGQRAVNGILIPLLSTGFACLAAWVLWVGLVKRQFSHAFTGTITSLGCLILAAVMLLNPQGTILNGIKMTDQAAGGVFQLVQGKTQVTNVNRAFGDSQVALWNATALPAWCALEFGDVGWCLKGAIPEGTPNRSAEHCTMPANQAVFNWGVYLKSCRDSAGPEAKTIADLWLQHPTNGSKREEIFEAWRYDLSTPQGQAVQMMQQDGTLTRFAVLGMVIATMLGAILLFGVIAINLIRASIMLLMMFMLTPFMGLVALLGDSGRATFTAWLHRLAGALLAKLVWATILGVVIFTVELLGTSPAATRGWLVNWSLMLVVFWTAFLKRDELLGWVSTSNPGRGGEGSMGVGRMMQSAFYATRMAGQLTKPVTKPAGLAARGAGKAGTGLARRGAAGVTNHRNARSLIAGQKADQSLGQAATASLGARLADSQALADEANSHRGEIATLSQAARRDPEKAAELAPRLEELRATVASPKYQAAEAHVREAAGNVARTGQQFTPEQLAAEKERRRSELGASAPMGRSETLRVGAARALRHAVGPHSTGARMMSLGQSGGPAQRLSGAAADAAATGGGSRTARTLSRAAEKVDPHATPGAGPTGGGTVAEAASTLPTASGDPGASTIATSGGAGGATSGTTPQGGAEEDYASLTDSDYYNAGITQHARRAVAGNVHEERALAAKAMATRNQQLALHRATPTHGGRRNSLLGVQQALTSGEGRVSGGERAGARATLKANTKDLTGAYSRRHTGKRGRR